MLVWLTDEWTCIQASHDRAYNSPYFYRIWLNVPNFPLFDVTEGVWFRACKNLRGCLSQSSLKNLGQILTVLAILDHFERFSPGQNGPKVGRPVRLFKVIWLEPFWPGEYLSNQPKIARAVRIWPKIFSNVWDRQPQKFSCALVFIN